MGTYLNPGKVLFQECLNSEIYVDKTELIRYTNDFINTENKLICVSRPRRFGKSMALKMLAAYYSKGCDAKAMFKNLKLGDFEDYPDSEPGQTLNRKWTYEKKKESFEKGLNRYDTIYLDMQGAIGEVLMDEKNSREILAFTRNLPSMSSAEKELTAHPLLTAIQRRIIAELREKDEYAAYICEEETFLGEALLNVYQKTGNQFVILSAYMPD